VHEVESGLVDLELARAVPRARLLTRSVLLSVTYTLCAALLMGVGTSAGTWLFDAGDMEIPDAALRLKLLANLFAVAACFAGYALAIGAFSTRWSTAFTTASLTAALLYLVDFLAIGWRPMRLLNWLSPFHYYPALLVITGDAPMTRDLAILLGAGVTFAAIGYWQFQRRDL
jgi:ABC-type transport system involved in multi-copper enzyme maturation permease subunit